MSLDEQQIENKMMTSPPGKKVFTFPGDGIWHPERIEATTRQDAERIWQEIKRLISGPAADTATTPAVPAGAPEQSTPAPDAKEDIDGVK